MRCRIFIFLCCCLCLPVWAVSTLSTDPNGTLYQYWNEANSIKYSKSLDRGITFGPSHLLYSSTLEVLSFDVKIGPDFTYYLVLATTNETYLTRSQDRGLTWEFQTTREAATSSSLAVDNAKNLHLLYVAEDKTLKINRLMYTPVSSPEPKVIYETADQIPISRIIAAPLALALFWQRSYSDRRENFLAVSLDNGKHFKTMTLPADIMGLVPYGNQWLAATYNPALSLKEIKFSPPPPPEPVKITGASSPEISYRLSGVDPILCKLEISWEKSFPAGQTWSFDCLNLNGSPEATYSLPVELPEGHYYLRLFAFDGLASSPPSKTMEFKIDRTPPGITLASPTEETTEKNTVTVSGLCSEPCRLSLNGQNVSVESTGKFIALLALQPGGNRLSLAATDEAGNTTTVSKTLVFIQPDFIVVKPKGADWYKPASTIYIQAKLNNASIRIEDEAEGDVLISDQRLEDKVFFDQKLAELSGFINLPEKYIDGIIPATIGIQDLDGNLHLVKFSFNIDSSPPVIKGTAITTGIADQVPIPVSDAGVGVDPSGTLVKIAGITLAGIVTIESDKLIVKTKQPLPDGSYEVEVTPRDLIGNTGKAAKFSLTVDTHPPVVIPQTAAKSTTQIITSFGNGPNPFFQTSDKKIIMYFTYQLAASPVDLNIYIFDLTGTLIWKKELKNAGSGSTTWNGIDQFGATVGGGVYPYIIYASAGDNREIKRGKIIVLQ